jgi:hypothetical protein
VRALIGVAAAVVLLVVPSSGMAQAALPVGEAHGVRIVREKGAIVVIFTKRAATRGSRAGLSRSTAPIRTLVSRGRRALTPSLHLTIPSS